MSSSQDNSGDKQHQVIAFDSVSRPVKQDKNPNETSTSASKASTSKPVSKLEAKRPSKPKNTFAEQRKKKLAKIWGKRFHQLFKMAFAVTAAWGLVQVVQLPYWVFDTPTFSLAGNHYLSKTMVLPLVEHETGQPFYKINPRQLSEAIRHQYPWLDYVAVRRTLIGSGGFGEKSLTVSVIEKPFSAAIYTTANAASPYALIAQDNSLVPIKTMPAEFLNRVVRTKPLTKVVASEGSIQKLSKSPESVERLNSLREQLSQIPQLTFNNLRFTPNGELRGDYHTAPTSRERVFSGVVWFGALDDSLPQRSERLLDLSDTIQRMGNTIDRVDLRWSKQVTLHRRGVTKTIKVLPDLNKETTLTEPTLASEDSQ